MKLQIVSYLIISSLISCGLKYTPQESVMSEENKSVIRKTKVEQYIWDSYKTTQNKYQPIVFAPTTIIRPKAYQQLDSLYELKYFNEQIGKYSVTLEQQISKIKTEIASSKQRIVYIEHHLYAIQNEKKTDIYYADIHFDSQENITDFEITKHNEINSTFLPIFKSYITHESIIHPNYQPSEEEEEFYNFFNQELNERNSYQQNNFLNHILKILYIARQIQSIETKYIIETIIYDELSQNIDNFNKEMINKIETVWDDDTLIYYKATVTVNQKTQEIFFSPYLEQEINILEQ